jgi:hypothetical protein
LKDVLRKTQKTILYVCNKEPLGQQLDRFLNKELAEIATFNRVQLEDISPMTPLKVLFMVTLLAPHIPKQILEHDIHMLRQKGISSIAFHPN